MRYKVFAEARKAQGLRCSVTTGPTTPPLSKIVETGSKTGLQIKAIPSSEKFKLRMDRLIAKIIQSSRYQYSKEKALIKRRLVAIHKESQH